MEILIPIIKMEWAYFGITVVDPVKIKGDDYLVKLEQPVKTPTAITSYANWTVICNSCVNEDTLVNRSNQ